MEPKDLEWRDVDAVKLLEECFRMEAASVANSANHGGSMRDVTTVVDCAAARYFGHSLDQTVDYSGSAVLSVLEARDYTC